MKVRKEEIRDTPGLSCVQVRKFAPKDERYNCGGVGMNAIESQVEDWNWRKAGGGGKGM